MIFDVPFTEDDLRRAKKVPSTPAMYTQATYVGIQALICFSEEYLNPLLHGLVAPTDRDKIILTLYWRMRALLASIYSLNAPSHFQSIASASRSFLELYFDLALIIRDTTGDSVARFHAFTRVERFRVADQAVTFFDAHPALLSHDLTPQRSLVTSTTERAVVETIVHQFWGKDLKGRLLWPKHWSKYQDARARAHALGLSFEALYVKNWYLLSWHVHSGGVGVAGLPKDAFDVFIVLAHELVREVAVESFSLIAHELRLDAVIADLPTKLAFLRRVPGFRLVDLSLQKLGEPERFTF